MKDDKQYFEEQPDGSMIPVNPDDNKSAFSAGLYAMYSRERMAWCVYKLENSISASFLWKCRTEEDARTLAKEVNGGAVICRGCQKLRSNCGTCVKCTLSV